MSTRRRAGDLLQYLVFYRRCTYVLYLQVFCFGQGERSIPVGEDGILQHSALAFAGSANLEFTDLKYFQGKEESCVTLIHLQEEVQLSALAQDLQRLDKFSAAAWYLKLIKYTTEE